MSIGPGEEAGVGIPPLQGYRCLAPSSKPEHKEALLHESENVNSSVVSDSLQLHGL